MSFERFGKPFAKRSFGQNFLSDRGAVEKITAALNLSEDDLVVEVGAGRGALTEKLVASGARVAAIELDKDLLPLLEEKFSGHDNFHLVAADVLKTDLSELAADFNARDAKLAKIVGNLPYNVSTAILQKMIQHRAAFSAMVLMLQREVAERIAAPPGGSERGFLTVLVEAYMKVEKLFDVPPHSFRPAPKVWSSVVKLVPKRDSTIVDDALFRALVSAGFTQKRKTILNNLKKAPAELKEKLGDPAVLLEKCGIEPNRRAESLTLAEWVEITATGQNGR
jgi:16S rRNA (adenine1518-N6/adenine1519-N6)-dimethyltransferase